MVDSRGLDTLLAAIKEDLQPEQSDIWFAPEGYSQIAPTIVDAIYSTGNHYSTVLRVVKNYRLTRQKFGIATDSNDSAQALIQTIEKCGGPEGFAEETGYNLRCYSDTKAPLKAVATLQAAHCLVEVGLGDADREQAREYLSDPEQFTTLKKKWLRVQSQSSGTTWRYFHMLMGVPGTKPDRMIIRYVTKAVGREVRETEAANLVREAASYLKVDEIKLDHAIWRFESGRAHLRSDNPEQLEI